jgi:hypothetical protein
MTRIIKNTLLFLPILFLLQQGFAQRDSTSVPPMDFSEYGAKVSVGISIIDGLGVPVRLYNNRHVFELGAYATGIVFEFDVEDEPDLVTVPMFGAGYTYFGNKFLKTKKKHNKIKSNGIAVRVNQIVGDYNTTIPSLSWAHESFKQGRTHRSFLFEMGIQYILPNYTLDGDPLSSGVGLRLRCQWNLFLK